MTQKKDITDNDSKKKMPGAEKVTRELGKATSIDGAGILPLDNPLRPCYITL